MQILATAPQLAAVAQGIVDIARELFHAEHAVLFDFEPHSGAATIVASAGTRPRVFVPGVRLPEGAGVVGLAIRTGTTVAASDHLADPRVTIPADMRRRLERFPYRSVLATPLVARGVVIGALAICDRRGREYTAGETSLLHVFADQAAVGFQTARLFDESERRRREAETLASLTRSLSEDLDPDRAARRVVDAACALLEADAAALYHTSGTSGLLQLAVESHRAPDRMRWLTDIVVGLGVVGRCAADGETVASADVLTDPLVTYSDAMRRAVGAGGARSILAVPLRIAGESLGVLALGDAVGRTFRDDEIRLAQAFADHAALALRNSRLHDAAVRYAGERVALLRATRTVMSGLDLRSTLDGIVDEASAIARTPHVTLLLCDEHQPYFRQAAIRGRPLPPGFDVPRDGSYAGRVAATGRPLFIGNTPADADNILRDDDRRLGVVTYLGLPVMRGGTVLGVLSFNTTSPYVYSRDELDVLQSFADQAALAIHNASIYADAQRNRRVAEVLSELVRSINDSLRLDTVLQRIVDAARELCASDLARVALADERGVMHVRCWSGTRFASDTVVTARGMGAHAAAHRRCVRSDDRAHDHRFEPLTSDAAEGIVTQMVVPILTRDAVRGLLFLSNRAPRPFTDRDEAIVTRLADHAAVAIDNAALFAREEAARRAAEASGQALERSEARYRGMVEGSIQGIVVHRDDRVLFANDAAARLVGYARGGDIVGASVRGFVAPGDRTRLAADRRKTGDPGDNHYEVDATRRDGAVVTLECVVSTIAWDRAPATLATLIDVTERKSAADALRASEEQVLQLQKMEALGRLAAGVAHDFNNLLTVIAGRAEILLRRGSPDHRLMTSLGLIRETAKRGADLTRQLLAFSRKQALQPTVLAANAVVQGMDRLLRRVVGEDVELALTLDPDAGCFTADGPQIEQVLMNLVVNARDAMPTGGRLVIRTGRTTIDAAQAGQLGIAPGPHVVLAVEDSGCGMDTATRERIFEPFFTTKGEQGTGLGLATVFGVVRQSRGAVRVESEVGAGTVFTVLLPRVESDRAAETLVVPPTWQHGTETLLLVEDEKDVRDVAVEILEDAGYTVLVAASGPEALRLAAAHAVDLLVSDVIMPGMSGGEVATRFLDGRPGGRVLFVSGYTDDVLGGYGLHSSRVALLHKPYSMQDLLRKVRDVLDGPI